MLNRQAMHQGAREIADFIAPIEQSLNASLIQQAQLLALTPLVRDQAKLPAAAGHQAIVHMVAAINATVEAQTAFLAAHQEFASLRDDLRIPATGLGSLDGCPSGHGLTVVESRAA
jgi:hypothetical protein